MKQITEILMTTKEVATYLKISTSWLESMRCKSDGPKYHKLGGKVLYKKTAIDNWLESSLVTPEGLSND